ncbi:hypothetical protein GCM10009798_24730 [Nocardioides panacihumi]|uniref:DUF1906 domain-containing protein n=1 Tax=Nocardioides panacihumi TaxID=400774 RepID=A0ABN2R4V7_9ACTN
MRTTTRHRAAAGLLLAASVSAAALAMAPSDASPRPQHRAVVHVASVSASSSVVATSAVPTAQVAPPHPTLPGGGRRVFADGRFLVAYYGTAGSGALGVLGEDRPDRMDARLTRAARAFGSPRRPVQKVYELIVTVADARPGRDGDYNHDVSHRAVRDYIAAAHRHGALVVLDLQPGRADFLSVARRWAWALADPWVGLALDPEWRMGPDAVPGRVIGSVGAAEVNGVSAWLQALTRQAGLPEKLFVIHQFRRDMLRSPGRVARRLGLAMVQHVDGYGTPGQKKATYAAVARPKQFTMGFKLFYDEDVHRMSARAVQRVRPRVRFVSFQ